MTWSPERRLTWQLQCLAMLVHVSSAAEPTLCGPELIAVAASHAIGHCFTSALVSARGSKHNDCFCLFV